MLKAVGGGSADEPKTTEKLCAGAQPLMSEAALYPYVLNWLEAEFPLVRSGPRAQSNRRAKITANLDWIDAGSWMRPDLALVHVHRRRFDPVATLDLYTFEVKPRGTRGLAGLHQTLAQGRIGDFVIYLLAEETDVGPDVLEQAARYGVGIVVASDPTRWTTYKVCVAPQRMNPDPDLRDMFLTRAFDGVAGEEIIGWIGDEPDK